MGRENAWQLFGLFLSGGLGLLLGFVYDLLRVWRALHRPSVLTVTVQDTLFGTAAAVAFFFFSLPVSGGEVRLYLLVGTAVGFFAYRGLIGRGLCRLCVRADRGLRRLLKTIRRPFAVAFRWLLAVLRCPFVFFGKKVKEFLKKTAVFLKKVLHLSG